jgi:hypothetical protein
MSTPDDGGPAFPYRERADDALVEPGLTLRDYFAGQALAGMLANPKWPNCDRLPDAEEKCAAHWAYDQADAMIAEKRRREKQE